MPSWNQLLDELEQKPDEEKNEWLREQLRSYLQTVSSYQDDRNVIFYASAFLQKPQIPAFAIQITREDVNGFMSMLHGMDWDKGLTLLLHTPGGDPNAAESIVSYLRGKFKDIEVIVPTYAMSAGTMISLASNRVIMGHQSQLGPIDPQIPVGNQIFSARGIVDQFAQAKSEILQDRNTAHVWAPVLQAVGPALLEEAQRALDYGERMVKQWLESHMFKYRKKSERPQLAEEVARYFNDAGEHKSHGRRIDRYEAKEQKLRINYLEKDQDFQDAVLSAYHLITLVFEKTPAAKLILNKERMWAKNYQPPE